MVSRTPRSPLLSLLVLTSVLVGAAVPAATADGPAVDPRAARVLREACLYLQSAQRFTVRLESTREVVLDDAQKVQYETVADVAVRRPDGVWVQRREDRGTSRMWYDGTRFTFLDEASRRYASIAVPPKIDAAFDLLAEKYGVSGPLSDLFHSDAYGILSAAVESGFYAGLHEVRGLRCHHLVLRGKALDIQAWVEDGPRPVFRKIAITYREEVGAPQYVAFLSGWDFAPAYPDTLFAFFLPEDAQYVPMEKLIAERRQGGDR